MPLLRKPSSMLLKLFKTCRDPDTPMEMKIICITRTVKTSQISLHYFTWLCDEQICVFLGDVLCVKKDVMAPFPQAGAPLVCRLLKQTLMRVRWKAALPSTILWKSFMANGTSWTTASSPLPLETSQKKIILWWQFWTAGHGDDENDPNWRDTVSAFTETVKEKQRGFTHSFWNQT